VNAPHEPDTLAELSALVGAPVVADERAAWGFANRTELVTLADGRRLVVQRITRRFFAPYRLALARTVPPALRALGISAPLLLAADAQHDPPYVVREFLPGTPTNALLDSDENATRLAGTMGALLPRLATIDITTLPLATTWAEPHTLASDMQRRLQACAPLLASNAHRILAALLAQLPALFANRPAVFAHGDFCPVNALLLDDRRPTTDDGRQTTDDGRRTTDDGRQRTNNNEAAVGGPSSSVGLLDFDEARMADALFDAAWWGWVVRYHHPERWHVAWPQFLLAASIPADTPTLERIRALQLLRLLEALDDARAHEPATALWWAERLHTTASWI
jgi:aminoglycoside phosphotransferase (APT) family kinase protein